MSSLLFDAVFSIIGSVVASWSPGRRRYTDDTLARVPRWLITACALACWALVAVPVVYMLAIAPGPMRTWLLCALVPGLVALTASAVVAVLMHIDGVDDTSGRGLVVRLGFGGLGLLAAGLAFLMVVGMLAFLNLMMNIG